MAALQAEALKCPKRERHALGLEITELEKELKERTKAYKSASPVATPP
jgi:hypothetical protein